MAELLDSYLPVDGGEISSTMRVIDAIAWTPLVWRTRMMVAIELWSCDRWLAVGAGAR